MIKEMDKAIDSMIRLNVLVKKLDYYMSELDDQELIDTVNTGNDSDNGDNVIYLK
jgi:hypothetical protein